MKLTKKIINLLLPILLGVFLVYYAYSQFSKEQLLEIGNHFKNIRFIPLATSIFFMTTAVVSRAYRWKYSINYMGYQSKFTNNFMAVCISYLVNFTIPRSGEISRALVLQKYENIPFDKSFGSIISERIIDLLCLLFFTSTAVLLQYDKIYKYLSEKIPFEKLILLSTTIIASLILFIYFVFFSNVRFFKAIQKKIQGFTSGILSIFRMPSKKGYLLHTTIIWLSYILSFYFGTLSLESTSHIEFPTILISFVVGSIAISFTNGGFGAFPLLISEILSLYQIPETASTAFGWILWTTQTIIFILLGAFSFILLPIYNKEKRLL